jgi:DNA-binding LacI/PurR family transcriptional regulator
MTGQPTHIALTAPYFGSPFQIAVLDHFRKLMSPTEFSFRASSNELPQQTDSLRRILAQAKPSVLIAISMSPGPDVVSAYRASNVPIILLDEEAQGASTIATDNHKGGYVATEHLVSKGRKRIAIVTGRTEAKGGLAGNYCARLRLKGFTEALARHGLAVPNGGIIEAPNFSREDGVTAMPKLLGLGIDAVFCAAADDCAAGLLTAAKERGVRVPEDIAIVSFDDLPVAQLSTPGLTTIRQPVNKMADAAYRMATIQREEILTAPKKILFEPELIIRQSA